MKTQIETLDEAIEAGLKIEALHVPSGEIVWIYEFRHGACDVKFPDGEMDTVSRNELTEYRWS